MRTIATLYGCCLHLFLCKSVTLLQSHCFLTVLGTLCTYGALALALALCFAQIASVSQVSAYIAPPQRDLFLYSVQHSFIPLTPASLSQKPVSFHQDTYQTLESVQFVCFSLPLECKQQEGRILFLTRIPKYSKCWHIIDNIYQRRNCEEVSVVAQLQWLGNVFHVSLISDLVSITYQSQICRLKYIE